MKPEEIAARAIADAHLEDFEDAKHLYLAMATAALRALEVAGYRVVPVEATEAMIEGARVDIICRRDCTVSKVTAKQVWRAMLDAAGGGKE